MSTELNKSVLYTEGDNNPDKFTNLDFVDQIDEFADQIKFNNQNGDNSQLSTENNTKVNKKNDKIKYNLIADYLIGNKSYFKEFKNSNNFVEKSVFPKKMKEYLEKIKNEFSPTTEKLNEEKTDFAPLFQIKPSNPPSILIMETINGNKLYVVYQDLINGNFSVINYSLKEVKNPNKANYLIIRNLPYLNDKNKNLIDKFNLYINYFSAGRKKKIIYPPIDKSKNSKNKKKRF